MNYGGKKPIFLVDLPLNTTAVKRNGKELVVRPLIVFSETPVRKILKPQPIGNIPALHLRLGEIIRLNLWLTVNLPFMNSKEALLLAL
jgi:hypothetical protein